VSSRVLSTAAVLGTGTMGRGIAEVLAVAGLRTHLFDASKEQLARALGELGAGMKRRVERGKIEAADATSVLARVVPFEDLESACREVDAVLEAVPESLGDKVALFARVKNVAPDTALLATNTSSLSVSEIGRGAGAKERVVGMHFFNPPAAMELVEVVPGKDTAPRIVDQAVAFAKQIGKTPIVVRDSPGFATSRLGLALGAEAMRMLETNVASIEDIDRAMELGYRHPMGPLKLTDLVGLDVRLAILEHLHRELGEQFRPPDVLRELVARGRLGKKVGHGFYVWTATGAVPGELP
jgi:3-hydroxybutyryl-CoA dehydrogenase